MSEARQLPPREPTVTNEELDVVGLPPLPAARPRPEAVAVSAHAPSGQATEIPRTAHSRALQTIDNASHKALIFLVVGLLAFVAGVSVAAAVVTGALDLQTGWVKEAMSLLKQAAKYVLSK